MNSDKLVGQEAGTRDVGGGKMFGISDMRETLASVPSLVLDTYFPASAQQNGEYIRGSCVDNKIA